MESFWLFHINGVGVAAASNETYNTGNTVIKPVSKMIEVKPGVLCSVIGPYEGIEQCMRFARETVAINPTVSAEQLMEDIKWMLDKKERNGNILKDGMKKLTELMNDFVDETKKDPGAPFSDKAEMMEEEARKLLENPLMQEEEVPEDNRMINQIKLTESLPDCFMSWGIAAGRNWVVQMDYYEPHSRPPDFNQWSLEGFKPLHGPDSFGNVILKMREEYLPKLSGFAPTVDTAKHLRELISTLDAKHNPSPAPLVFMQSAPYTGLRWVDFND